MDHGVKKSPTLKLGSRRGRIQRHPPLLRQIDAGDRIKREMAIPVGMTNHDLVGYIRGIAGIIQAIQH